MRKQILCGPCSDYSYCFFLVASNPCLYCCSVYYANRNTVAVHACICTYVELFFLMCMLLFFLYQVPYFDLSFFLCQVPYFDLASETWEEYQTTPEHSGRIDNLSRHDEENHQIEGGSRVLCACTWIRCIMCVVCVCTWIRWIMCVVRVHGLGGSCVLCACTWMRCIMCVVCVYMDEVDHVCCACVHG